MTKTNDKQKEGKCCDYIEQTRPRLNKGEYIIRHAPYCKHTDGVVVLDNKKPSDLAVEITYAWRNKSK